MEDGSALKLLFTSPRSDEDPSGLDNITNKLVLAKPDQDPEGNTRHWLMTYVMATAFITRLAISHAKVRNGMAQKNLCSFLASFSELRSAAGKIYEATCHSFLVGQGENSRNLWWYERQTTDFNTDSVMGHAPPQRVPWAQSRSIILPRELPTNSRKASDALAAYAKELPEDGIHYIRPLNPNQATWDALILQKSKSDLAVFYLQMSYCKDHEINHKGLQFVREALSNFQTNFTYVLVLHPGENQQLISRKSKINFHINERTPKHILRPLWQSQTSSIRGGRTNSPPPSLKSMRDDLNGDNHDWAGMKQYIIPVSTDDLHW